MATCKRKTIEEIDDPLEMYKAMKALGISCSGLKTLDEMKAKVKDELNPSADEPSWTAGQVTMLQKCYWVMVIGTLFCRVEMSKTVQRYFLLQ